MNTQYFMEAVLLQVTGMTPGRAAAMVPMIVGLVSTVIGCVAFARAFGSASLRVTLAFIAIALGVLGGTLSAQHLAKVTGALGTGSGKLGGIIGVVLSILGVIVGVLAWYRANRNTASQHRVHSDSK